MTAQREDAHVPGGSGGGASRTDVGTGVLSGGHSGIPITVSTDGVVVDLENLRIEAGYNPEQGGGLACTATADLALRNMVFSGNTAAWGGGIYAGEGCGLLLQECTFEQNQADQDGGGIRLFGSAGASCEGCVFLGNTAGREGGGIATHDGVTLQDTTFADNLAETRGGGLVVTGDYLEIRDCAFTGNASTWGGVIHLGAAGTATITGTTFVEGGVYVDLMSDLEASSVTFEGATLHVVDLSSATLSDARFTDCEGGTFGGALSVEESSSSGTCQDTASIR